MLIDKGKSYSFKDDRVDQAQVDYNYIADWVDDAAIQMRVTIDTGILGDIYSDAHANNSGSTAGAKSSSFDMGTSGTPKTVTKDNVVEFIQDMGSVLDEANIPEEDRYIVAPVWFCNRIGKSDLKDASLSGDTVSIARNGRLGMIDRFTIYRSNSLSVVSSNTNMIFGHKCALTFASQIIENEGPLLHPDFFGRFYRGLNVYGYKVIKPDAFGHAVAVAG